MEPDVIHMYSASPPPLEDVNDDDDFNDFPVPNSISFTEFETPTTFNQLQALTATSPPELMSNGRVIGLNGPAVPNGSQGDAPACRTVSVGELKKVTERPYGAYTHFSDLHGNSRTGSDAVDCNGGGREVFTNGFANFGTEEAPPLCHKRRETGPSGDCCPDAILSDNSFADFAAFSNIEVFSHADIGVNMENSNYDLSVAQDNQPQSERNHGPNIAGKAVDDCVTGFASFKEATDHLSNGDGCYGQMDQDTDTAHKDSNTTESVRTDQRISQDGLEVRENVDNRVSPVSMDERGSSSGPTEEKGSGNDTETETETSFGRPLSTEALEEFGDFSTTGSVPSPPLQEETATPADHSQLAEDDDEDFGDFGDFGDAGSFGGAGFADFDQQGAVLHTAPSESIAPLQSFRQNCSETACFDKDEFGNFDAHNLPGKTEQESEKGAENPGLSGSDSFADFTAAPIEGNTDDNGGWQAFSETNKEAGESWATFGQDQRSTFLEKREDWHESRPFMPPPTGSTKECRKDSITVSFVSRLEKLFLACFFEISLPHVEEDVPPLKAFLELCEGEEKPEKEPATVTGEVQGVWLQLQDIHNAFGLRYQWGGSHSNKALLCSLGIDTRNILFTGQKKQPVIVPMYAASLGMLEPTKEPVKPISAAEMIASIAQCQSVTTEMNPCPSNAAQESLPPVQFDWSSSGLTNPLDGVDPELYELTQAKLDVSSSGSNRVVDAFARLMSTVEKTNTSTRRVQTRKEENLSEEARHVISALPDLSFMQAKVLMFPSTLTPLPPSSCSSISPSPVPD